MKTIGITGGTGFVGRHITQLLRSEGHEVVVFTRSPKPAKEGLRYAAWNPDAQKMDEAALSTVDAIIHLAGAGVAEKRWTPKYKKEIIHSRVDATHFLHDQLAQHAPRCKAFVAASATGYYGPDRAGAQMPFTETAMPYNDFLAQVCMSWEGATFAAQSHYRTAALRIGIVLGRDGGAYPKLTQPMALGVVPVLGSGKQIVSWIHIDDLAALFVKAALNTDFSGVYNAVAPHPVTHRDLMMTIAHAKGGIKIPVSVPRFVLNIVMGEASVEVLKSCTVSSEKLQTAGFKFRHEAIEAAVRDLVKKREG